MPIPEVDERLLKALGHPLRRSMLELLDDQPASSKELAEHLGRSLNVVSYHMGILRDLGLVEVASQTKRRGATETHYRTGTYDPTESLSSHPPQPAASATSQDAQRLKADVERRSFTVDAAGLADLRRRLDELWSALEQLSDARQGDVAAIDMLALVYPTT